METFTISLPAEVVAEVDEIVQLASRLHGEANPSSTREAMLVEAVRRGIPRIEFSLITALAARIVSSPALAEDDG